jgi:two-component system sensor histidine kinase KdpD
LSPALEKFHVTVSLPPDLPLLEFDAVLIERVLCNLLDNAVKYSADGRAIRIAAEYYGADVHVAVEDHGPGIPIGMEKSIFEKFARIQPESVQPGVGLGLSICRTIVEAHHGHLWMENRPEGGSCFVFSLPVGSPPAVEELADES